MDNEFVLFFGGITLCVITFIGGCTYYNVQELATKERVVAEALKTGVSPIAAACGIDMRQKACDIYLAKVN